MSSNRIYMDNHATTPLDPRVLEAMMPYFTEKFGNAASRNHSFGWEAEEACEKARSQIANLIGSDPKEIIFTSGATESDNMAIKGVAEYYRDKGNHIITVATEHKAVLDTCKSLQRAGKCRVTYLPVDGYGMIDLDQLSDSITPQTILITIMFANNEIGVIHPVAEIGRIARQKGVLFHCDAAQALGKEEIDVQSMGIDLMSISAHKVYGPKGVGALYIRRKDPRTRVHLTPIIDGGGHERGLRSGTLNVPGIVGFGQACEIARQEMRDEMDRLRDLRERLKKGIFDQLEHVYLNGHPTKRLAGNLNLSFAYVEGESLLMGLSEIALSSGSACTSASLEPSYVLHALGVSQDLAHSSIRFGLGRFNTQQDVDYTIKRVVETVLKLREMSPLYEMVKRGIDLKSVKWEE
jgi:cysteine desulfurase